MSLYSDLMLPDAGYTPARYDGITVAMLDDAAGTDVQTLDPANEDRRNEDHYEGDAYSVADATWRAYDEGETTTTIEQHRTESRIERKARYAREAARKARAALYPESSLYVERTASNGERVADFYALPNRLASFFTAYRTDAGDLIGLVCKCGARLSWEGFDGTREEYALRVAQHTYRHNAEGKPSFPHAPKFLAARDERHAKWEAQYAEREAYRAGRLLDHGRTSDL